MAGVRMASDFPDDKPQALRTLTANMTVALSEFVDDCNVLDLKRRAYVLYRFLCMLHVDILKATMERNAHELNVCELMLIRACKDASEIANDHISALDKKDP